MALPLRSGAKTGEPNTFHPTGDPWGTLEPDKYGAELAREARVWKVYVGETDKQDAELVDGWNKSLDVLLVFAALFSAISTSFLIQASGMLTQNPSDVSATALLTISQTLLIIANNSLGNITVPQQITTSDFVPSQHAIILNTLWYLSLSLSLATAFLAMLAKDWCYSFSTQRSGPPRDQAMRRQRKWTMIERWKMQEVIHALPLLIHLSLLLFAVGLCIYLWDLNSKIAKPVISVFGSVFLFYALSSIAACCSEYSPYTTILSRFLSSHFMQRVYMLFLFVIIEAVLLAIMALLIGLLPLPLAAIPATIPAVIAVGLAVPLVVLVTWAIGCPILIADKYGPGFFAKSWSDVFWIPPTTLWKAVWKFGSLLVAIIYPFVRGWQRIRGAWKSCDLSDDTTTSLVISWLIQNCETPSAVTIALQAIAGATPNIPVEPLELSQASMKISQRMASLASESEDRDRKLYERGRQFLSSFESTPGTDPDKGSRKGEVEAMVWYIKSESERQIAQIIENVYDPRQIRRLGPLKFMLRSISFMTAGIPSRMRRLTLWRFMPRPASFMNGPAVGPIRGGHNFDAIELGNTAVIAILDALRGRRRGVSLLDYLTKRRKLEGDSSGRISTLLHSHVSETQPLHPAAFQSLAYAATLNAACLTAADREPATLSPIVDLYLKFSKPLESLVDWDPNSQVPTVLAICVLLRRGRLVDPPSDARIKCTVATLMKVCSMDESYHYNLMCVIGHEVFSSPDVYGWNPKSLNEHEGAFNAHEEALRKSYRRYLKRHTWCFAGFNPVCPPALLYSGKTKARQFLETIGDVYGILFSASSGDRTVGLLPPIEVYQFVAMFTCSIKSASDKDLQLCKTLLSQFGFPRLTGELNQLLAIDRTTGYFSPPSLITLLGNTNNRNPVPEVQHFAATQLWLLLQLVGDSSTDDQQALSKAIGKGTDLQIQGSGLEQVKTDLADSIVNAYRGQGHLGIYSARVVECVLQARGEEADGDLRDKLDSDLAMVPSCIRGLSSFAFDQTSPPQEPPNHLALNVQQGSQIQADPER